MKKVIRNIVAITFTTLLLSGCWDSSEPEEASLVSIIGVNLTSNRQIECVVQDQLLTPKNQTNNITYHLHKSTGSTLYDAIQQNMLNNPQGLYLAHTKAIILSEEFARVQGIRPLIDFLERNPEIRQNTLFLISKKGEFEKIFLPDTSLRMNSGKIIDAIITNGKTNSLIISSKLRDFLQLFWGANTTPYALGVETNKTMIDDKTQDIGTTKEADAYNLNVGDIAIFKNEKMVGWLIGNESRGLLWANGKIKGGTITVNFEEKPISFKISNIKSTIKPTIKNEAMKIAINIKLEADIGESNADVDFGEKSTINAVKLALAEQIKKEIREAITVSKNLNSDVFQFANSYYQTYPNYWRKVKKDWDIYYPDLDVTIKADSNIQYIGLVKKPIKSEK